MGISDPSADIDRIKAKLEGVFGGMAEELKEAGESAADAIVQTTLAGIGEDDQAFAPYSPAYLETINAVGGKPQGTVNLRGVFYHDGQRRYQGRAGKTKNLGQGRRAYVSVAFGKTKFTARTKETRPMRGVEDKRSEMSRDLIKAEATDTRLKIIYTPRSSPHMIAHQKGENRMPKRTWFTLKKQAVWAAMVERLKQGIVERARRFNAGG